MKLDMTTQEQLRPIVDKEAILRTANAKELHQMPEEALKRYQTYALTHIPLGDTSQQLANLRRVITQNKHCAVGTVVGPYGYGKTSTAVHLWHELREQQFMAIPPFVWVNLSELMDSVYYWVRHELANGAKPFVARLDALHRQFQQRSRAEFTTKLDEETVQEWIDRGRLVLDIRPDDVLGFVNNTCALCLEAGYKGLAIFTDELQVTLAEYKPHRDQFFNDLFQLVTGILGTEGNWAMIISMNDDTEGTINRLRADLLQRMQRSALYFRVDQMYDRRDYPADLWAEYQKRFGFDGATVIQPETIESIGQVASRHDLGAGPRMVTNAFVVAAKHFIKTGQPYTPLQFVDDFLAHQIYFDQRGKFVASVRKALDHPSVARDEELKRAIKLMGAYPLGCPQDRFEHYGIWKAFQGLVPLGRRELVTQLAGGYTLRYLLEIEAPPEQIEQRLTKEFSNRFTPGKSYHEHVAAGFANQVLWSALFSQGWDLEAQKQVELNGLRYHMLKLRGMFELRFPDRRLNLLVASVKQSPAPVWTRADPDVDIEMRFELNYGLAESEPNRLLMQANRPEIAVFQLNVASLNAELAGKVLPSAMADLWPQEQLTPYLCLALVDYLFTNRGDLPDDQNRVAAFIGQLRQYVLALTLPDSMEVTPAGFGKPMVGTERIKDVFKQQCAALYGEYHSLITSKSWKSNVQYYTSAVNAVARDSVSLVRGGGTWQASKKDVAEAFGIPGRRLTTLETVLDVLDDLIVKEDYSGKAPESMVKLRFKLHKLEQVWLAKLESSPEKIKRGGFEVAAMPARDLLRVSLQLGYTPDEVHAIMQLLQARQLIDLDQTQGLITRRMDNLVDLQDALKSQLNELQSKLDLLARGLPDFDRELYPISRLRTALESATARDQLEKVRDELRASRASLAVFVNNRLAATREKLKAGLQALFERSHEGVPGWLARGFESGPLRAALERQRQDVAAAYQKSIDDMRRLREEFARLSQSVVSGDPTPEMLFAGYDLLEKLQRQSKALFVRADSYVGRQEDFDAWRRAMASAAEADRAVTTSLDVYGNRDFKAEVDKLWRDWQQRFERQAMTTLGEHALALRQIAELGKRVNDWLGRRREEFDTRCGKYEAALGQVGARESLRIPYDPDDPGRSNSALAERVRLIVTNLIDDANMRLVSLMQTARYGRLVQLLDLGRTEQTAQELLARLVGLREALDERTLGDPALLQSRILAPFAELSLTDERLRRDVAQVVRKLPPTDPEQGVLAQLKAAGPAQIDVRSLILQQLGRSDDAVDVTTLMRQLQGLFQKNQIALIVQILPD